MEWLLDDDVQLEAVRQAVAENRLALLPAERSLTGDERYSAREIAERSGVALDYILRQQQALGMPRPDPDARVLTDEDAEAVERVRRFREAGLPDEGMIEVGRAIGQAMENVTAATREVVGPALLQPGDTELELARRYAEAVAELAPLMGSVLDYQYRVHLREGLRRATITPEVLESGDLPGVDEVAIGFADLVGFTRLGERLPAADLGRLAGRLAELAGEVVAEPVRVVKTIGDAVMLASAKPAALLETLLALLEAAEGAGEDFPELSVGAAFGTALPRGGDWYGRPVNIASRVTDVARPGSVLATDDLREAVGSSDEAPYSWSRIPRRRLKGVEGYVALYRVRRAGERDG